MRQTTMLIAQLSSASGVRAPLAHVADEVFLSLSRELEQQGLSRKVVADMFGLALRGYQRRVQRLSESRTERGVTQWQAVLQFIESSGPVLRKRILERFQYDDEAALASVLRDLTSSGLVYRTGSGDESLYGITKDSEREALAREGSLETLSSLVWLELGRAPERSPASIAAQLALPIDQVEHALSLLEGDGRLRRENGRLIVEPMIVPVGAAAGWEVAFFDHFQTVCVALATKVSRGRARSHPGDTTGGQTFSFDLDDDHPERDAVLGLLGRIRQDVNELWERVEAHNRAVPRERPQRVRFYLGQVEMPTEDEC